MESHLTILKREHPDFPWPEQGARHDYPEELGAILGDIRRFSFLGRKYELIFRSSRELSAIHKVEELISEGKKALITYNPIRLETYGVWIHPMIKYS